MSASLKNTSKKNDLLARERVAIYNIFAYAPSGVAILMGPTFVYEFINTNYEKLVVRKITLGKTVKEHFLEIEQQDFMEILNTAFNSGEAIAVNELPVKLITKRDGILKKFFLNTAIQPLKNETGQTEKLLVHISDVTESVNTRKKLQDSNNHLDFAIEASELGTWDYNPVTNKFTANNRLKDWFGLPNEEEIDLSLAINAISEKDRSRVLKTIRIALEDKSFGIYDVEYCIINPLTKQERIVKAKGKAWFEDDKKAYRLNGILQDITQQINARIEIEKTASHLKLATDSANAGTWSLDIKTQKLEWSDLHKRMWGYDEHRTDLSYKDWHELLLPGDKEKAFEKVEEARVSHTPYQADYCIKRADDGALRHVRSYGKYHYDHNGEAEILTGISVDITNQKVDELKLKASEEKYRGLFKTMDQGFCIIEMIFDKDNKPVDYLFIEANGMFEKHSGTSNPVGKTIKQLVPNMEERWFQIYGKVALTGEANHFVEHSEGLNRWFEVHTFRLEDQMGKNIAVLFTDITERKLAEEKMQENETQFRVFANSIQNLAWIAGGDGWIHWYNDRWYDFTGTTLEEMQGWGWQKVHHPDHIEKVTEASIELWKKPEPFELTFPLRRHDGKYRWFLTRAHPVIDANGKIERWIGTNTDITEQKSFTEELEKRVQERTAELVVRNTFIQTLIDSSLDLIIAIDKDLHYLSVNKAANKSFAAHFPDGVIGKKIEDVIPSVHETGVYDKVREALRGNTISQKEYLSFYEKKYYDVDFIPLRNEKEIYGVMSISRDVTEKVLATLALKKANVELEERKNLVETILESSKEYIAVYAKDFSLITINKATEILMGKKRKDVIGKTLLELIPQSKGSKEELDLTSALEGNTIYNEAYHSPLTGRYIENYINPLKDSEGNVYAAVVLGNDVSNIISRQIEIENARKQLQIQNDIFEAAEEIAKFGSYTWNITTGTLVYSDNLFRLLDCEPQEFLPSNEKFLSFIHPEDLQEVIDNSKQTIQTDILREISYRIVSKLGRKKHFRSSGKYTREGDHIMFIGTVQDTSNDIEAAEELQEKNQKLLLTNSQLASFTYAASHDLQEPLRKIQTFSKYILETEKFSNITLDYFNRIITSVERMRNLIVSLLDYSRTDMAELNFVSCDLNLIVEESKSDLNLSILEKHAIIEYKNLSTINGLYIQLSQLFTNIIENAIKYSRPEIKPVVKITSSIIEGKKIDHSSASNQKEYHVIKIADNGIGFEKEYATKIFELFQRLHANNAYSGTGVGLAIVKKIVTNHNGFIVAEGTPNIGSTFTIYIPTL